MIGNVCSFPNHPITTSAVSNDRDRREQSPITHPLRTIASCRIMRAMSGFARPTMTSSAIFVISITETTTITVPAGPGERD